MTEKHLLLLSGIIMTVLAVYSIDHQEVYATGIDELMLKMIEVDSKLSSLENSDNDFNELTISKTSFQMNQIKKSLLEINEMNERNDYKVNQIYEYLKINYDVVFDKFQEGVKVYQKENGLTMQEKKLVEELSKNKMTFETNQAQQNFKITQQELIDTAIKVNKAKVDYQKLVNEIGTKLAIEANGNKIENIQHKIAIKEIISSKTWDLAIPAIDRIINQSNNDEINDKLEEIKVTIKELLDKKEKQTQQNQTFTLKNDNAIKIDLNTNEIGFAGILGQSFENEIIESLIDSEEIFSEFEEKLERELGLKIEEANTLQIIESIIETELTEVLEDVTEISDNEDNKLNEEREKQRKDARDKKGENRSDRAKEVLENKENSNSSANSKGKGNNKA